MGAGATGSLFFLRVADAWDLPQRSHAGLCLDHGLSAPYPPLAVRARNGRVADIHVSHLSSGGVGVPGTLARACNSPVPGCSIRTACLSPSVPALGRPDIHLLSRAPKSLHRRLSLCSLPVPNNS